MQIIRILIYNLFPRLIGLSWLSASSNFQIDTFSPNQSQAQIKLKFVEIIPQARVANSKYCLTDTFSWTVPGSQQIA